MRCVRKRDEDEDRKELVRKRRGGEGTEGNNGEARKIKRDADG